MCDSDEFDGGSELASLAFSQGPRSSPRKAHKGTSGRSSGSSTTPICYFCLAPNAEKSYKCVWLHIDPCFNAVRARQRQTSADKTLAAQDIQDMKTNVARWREKHEPFMTKDPTARQAARLQVQSHILLEESVKTTSEKNISDCVMLNKTRYKNYRKFWDGCESDTASEDFAELHRVQAGEHDYSDDGGEAVEAVACKDNVRVRNSKRKKTRLGTRTETRDGDERDTTYQREASPLHHGRFEADQTLVPRDDAGFTRGDGRNASPATVRRSRSSRRRNVSLHVLEGKGSRANVAPSEAGLGVKFLQTKEKMKADVEALLDRISGPKGTQAELTAAMDQLRRRKGIFGGSVFEDMLTVIQQTLASEASEAIFF